VLHFSSHCPAEPSQPAKKLETMASSEINIIAIITPHPDKFSIVEELVKDVAAKVHENEPGVLAYQAHVERKKDGSGTIVFVEK
jgi:quinol monooxygenase YgiN